MIGLDTCVLVRHFTQDDTPQARHASRVIASFSSGCRDFVPLAALVELVWVLKKRYAFTRKRITRVLVAFLESHWIVLESYATVCRAMVRYGKTGIDFGDCVILESCQSMRCRFIYTFDRRASRVSGFRRVPD